MSGDVLTFQELRDALTRVADRIVAAREELCALDAIAGGWSRACEGGRAVP